MAKLLETSYVSLDSVDSLPAARAGIDGAPMAVRIAAACRCESTAMPAWDDDEVYYRLRERQARAMADRASDPHIRAIHLRFAEAYARRARAEANRTQAA